MGAESARLYNYNQAKQVVDSLGRIISRINKKHTPTWMRKELEYAYHKTQCIQQEHERIMLSFGEKI